ncbi:hypothetical protein POTOM_028282 [Populus tomentosa]|uniref:YMGG-like Gly-zipper domain-containing protein n=1 Tax=Populus tomentosa TaxID=118781 RepID=A0A8X7ZIU4_POPTO|nr:hypothetical protein POTOM_028282 [Populus tomentosa]
MEVYPCPSRFSMSSLSSFGNFVEKVKEVCNLAVSASIGNIFSAIFTFFFALVWKFLLKELALSNAVGTLLGAMTGALIGQETESGFVRGAAVGAISGAVFSIEVFESSLVLWQSDESGIGCVLYLIDVIASLLSGRLVRERIGPAMLSAVQSQMGAVETNFEEITNIFDTGGSKGLPGDSLEKIPKIKITSNNNGDATGEKVACSVCLQISGSLNMHPALCVEGISDDSVPYKMRNVTFDVYTGITILGFIILLIQVISSSVAVVV